MAGNRRSRTLDAPEKLLRRFAGDGRESPLTYTRSSGLTSRWSAGDGRESPLTYTSRIIAEQQIVLGMAGNRRSRTLQAQVERLIRMLGMAGNRRSRTLPSKRSRVTGVLGMAGNRRSRTL